MNITLVKTLSGTFKCAYDSDLEKSKKIKLGEEKVYEYKVRTPRNYEFHKKVMALFNMVFQNQEQYKDFTRFRRDLVIASGHYVDNTNYFTGEMTQEAKSLSYDNMSEEELQQVYSDVLDTITKIYRWEKQDIIDNLESFY